MSIINKRILIIGGSGSIGNTLTSRYIQNNTIMIYSRGENNHWIMKQKFNSHKNLHFYIGDISDKNRVTECIFEFKPNIIIIAAALKHIDIAEKNITECLKTNIDGVKNVINIVSYNATKDTVDFLETILFISTDKACSPINVYGMSKAISERIVIEKSEYLVKPKFVNVRYGNVMNSRGSLIPFFKNIAHDNTKNEFTVTDYNMTRYFMSLEDSANLIEYALLYGNTGETIVPKNISSYRILDIANHFSKTYDKPVVETGIRPGEKIHEALISHSETYRTVERDGFYVIFPSYSKCNKQTVLKDEFNSLMFVGNLDEKIHKAFKE